MHEQNVQTKLWLADDASFDGFARPNQKPVTGEVVFNTGMVGYVETFTDPSYAGQILVLTYPLVGNYGVPKSELWESGKIHLAGVVMSEMAAMPSHAKSVRLLQAWLDEQGVAWMVGVDTRALTKHLRSRGTMAGSIQKSKPTPAIALTAHKVTLPKLQVYNEKQAKTVLLIDCGAKENIVRMLIKYPVRVTRVPMDYDFSAESYDGILVSNGPGDPTDYPEVVANLKRALRLTKPIFGICLGSQLMALAAGAETYKLPFGHRGQNQPCIGQDERCVITSQNHGYAIDANTLPKTWQVTYRNLNDNSVEGIAHRTKPFFSVQFHPEAAPGPTDTADLFERFYESL